MLKIQARIDGNCYCRPTHLGHEESTKGRNSAQPIFTVSVPSLNAETCVQIPLCKFMGLKKKIKKLFYLFIISFIH